MKKYLIGAALAVVVAAPLVAINPAQAHTDDKSVPVQHVEKRGSKVVFKAWGDISRGSVDIDARHDIERTRSLPYREVQYLSGFDLDWAMMSVEDMNGFGTVGCSITVNGRLVAREVSDYGLAFCSNL
jgi:hypothetical protein